MTLLLWEVGCVINGRRQREKYNVKFYFYTRWVSTSTSFVFGKVSILLSSKGTLLPRYVAVAIRVDGEENFGIPRNFIGALSVSSKREKRYPWHMNGFPHSKTFISPFHRHRLQENREKTCGEGKKRRAQRFVTPSMSATPASEFWGCTIFYHKKGNAQISDNVSLETYNTAFKKEIIYLLYPLHYFFFYKSLILSYCTTII